MEMAEDRTSGAGGGRWNQYWSADGLHFGGWSSGGQTKGLILIVVSKPHPDLPSLLPGFLHSLPLLLVACCSTTNTINNPHHDVYHSQSDH